jgi:hypothetical protein
MMTPGVDEHPPEAEACVRALRRALGKQVALAESMGFEIAVRFLNVLDELSKDPGVTIAYKTMADGTPVVLPASQVSGLFAAILLRYRQEVDWSPLFETRRAVTIAQLQLTTACVWLDSLLYTMPIDELTRTEIKAFLEKVRQPVAPPSGPSGS